MSSGELSFESSPSLRFTWNIPDFFRLGTESGYTLRSPDFTFADGRYCLQLFRIQNRNSDYVGIQLLNLSDTDPVLLYEVQVKSRIAEIHMSRHKDYKDIFLFYRNYLESNRDRYVPDGTFTVLCSVRLRNPSSAGTPESGGAQAQVIPVYRLSCGDLSFQSFPFVYVTWRIPGFLQLSRASRCTLVSPEFLFSDRRYCMRLYPSGGHNHYVDIQLVNMNDTVAGRHVSYEVGLKSRTGEEIYIDCYGSCTARKFCILESSIDAMQHVSFPDGHLTVFCSLRSREPSNAGNPESGGAESQVVPGSKAAVLQAATHPKSVVVQTWNEEEYKKALPAFNKMLKDMERLLASGENSDVSLLVGGKEFRVHRNILCARSPVFKAMLCHETSERDSGTVNIEDCDPDRFQDFLTYVYTGSTKHIDTGNVISLFAISDKYLMKELKEACASFMKDNMSVEGFCDIATLALRHDDNELIESASKFFCENSKEVIETENWNTFLEENPKEAYKHFIKPSIHRR